MINRFQELKFFEELFFKSNSTPHPTPSTSISNMFFFLNVYCLYCGICFALRLFCYFFIVFLFFCCYLYPKDGKWNCGPTFLFHGYILNCFIIFYSFVLFFSFFSTNIMYDWHFWNNSKSSWRKAYYMCWFYKLFIF